MVIRVFVPHALLTSECGYLVGWHNGGQGDDESFPTTVFIWAVIQHSYKSLVGNLDFLNENKGEENSGAQCNVTVVGVFEPLVSSEEFIKAAQEDDTFAFNGSKKLFLYLRVNQNSEIDIPRAFYGDKEMEPAKDYCDIILFEPIHFSKLSPEVLLLQSNGHKGYVKLEQPADDKHLASVDMAEAGSSSHLKDVIFMLFNALSAYQQSPFINKEYVLDFTLPRRTNCGNAINAARRSCSEVIAAFVSLLSGLLYKTVFRSGCLCLMEKAGKFSNVGCQLTTRTKQLNFLKDKVWKQQNQLRFWNTVLIIFMDIILGIFLTVMWHNTGRTSYYLELFFEYTGILVNQLKELLVWLMGVPAGFKLNSPLSSAMGSFFLYHLYLWEAYLYIIKPVLTVVWDVCFYSGIFGLCVLLSALQDLFAIATFHVYCFYAYAARIYRLNFSGLVSFGRLFRGKKWNPLRKYIDSCSYDVHQMFLGTLCFTILLFLLPTTLMYYVVFTVLRINVLVIQSLAQMFVRLLNALPLYSIVLHFVKSEALVGNLTFLVVPQNANNPLILAMKGAICSWNKAIFGFLPPVDSIPERPSLKAFLANLLGGKLIHPF
ncbi:hypothetical protein CHUAL_011743 [Chamberlinius hualienensis]